MHQHDGDGLEAARADLLQGFADFRFVQFLLDFAIGQNALVDLGDEAIEQLRFDDVLGENIGPRLVADLQGIAEAARGDQGSRLAFALQESVGRNRGSHAYLADGAGGYRLARIKAHQCPYAGNGRIPIGAGIFGQHFAGMQVAFGVASNDIGERTAAIDPEIPM